MAPDLIDFRTKVTSRAHSVLTAVARATGRDMAELAREILDKWADERIHESTLILRLTQGEGHGTANSGGDAI